MDKVKVKDTMRAKWVCAYAYTVMVCLEVKKRRESRVEGGRVIQLPCLEVF